MSHGILAFVALVVLTNTGSQLLMGSLSLILVALIIFSTLQYNTKSTVCLRQQMASK